MKGWRLKEKLYISNKFTHLTISKEIRLNCKKFESSDEAKIKCKTLRECQITRYVIYR